MCSGTICVPIHDVPTLKRPYTALPRCSRNVTIAELPKDQSIALSITITLCECFDFLYEKELKHNQVKLVIELFFSMKFKRMNKQVHIVREVKMPEKSAISPSRAFFMILNVTARKATDVLVSFQNTIYSRYGNFQENLLPVKRF